MLVVETRIDIAAPPMRVWRILCDFQAYSRWNPYREIDGEAVLGARVVMAIGPANAPRRRLKATISAMAPGECFALTSGRPFISRAVESFHLERSARGTLLRHTSEMPEFAIRLFGGDRFRARLATVYGTVDNALKDHATSQGKILRHRGPPPKREK